jgi:hypothetical protein
MLYVDATQLRMFTDCRESYRLAYIENLTSAKPQIHRAYGIELHRAVESFWRGNTFEETLHAMMENLNNVSTYGCTPDEQKKWQEMVSYAPDMLATYWDGVEYDETRVLPVMRDGVIHPAVEVEWSEREPFGIAGVTLCGRIDRAETGPKLIDLKTASEVGKNWRSDYRATMLRDMGLSLYDWYLCQIGHTPVIVELEVLLKPYRDKRSRLEVIQFPEIVTPAYRKRFESQLKWVLRELAHYHENYLDAKPWPMSTNAACSTKFGTCQYLPRCLYGSNTKTDKLYTIRQEHLDIRKGVSA